MSAQKNSKHRADELLVEQGHAKSAPVAAAMIMAGQIIAIAPDGKERKVQKPGEQLRRSMSFRVRAKDKKRPPYVSRGGLKLERALDAFSIVVKDAICADIGLSTGGFSDCLLRRGAARVHGVDVGYGDVHWRLRNDDRMRLWERTNARHLAPCAFGELVQLAVIDVSFISLSTLFAPVCAQLQDGGKIIALVKPQFEAKRADAPKGVVVDPAVRKAVMERIKDSARAHQLEPKGEVDSPITGADGNVELLLLLCS